MKRNVNGSVIRAHMLNLLQRRGYWGENYFPIDEVIHQGIRFFGNGKIIRDEINSLVEHGDFILHKGGNTVSLNPKKSKEIGEFLHKMGY